MIMTRPTQREYDQHRRLHYGGSQLSDIILGGQDGLVNVLGVILGVAAATADTRIILAAGMAATFAESISMGAVAYTSALADRDYYRGERERERRHIREFAAIEREEIRRIFTEKGFEGDLLETIVKRITSDEQRWVDVMMAEEFQLSPIDEREALKTSFVVGLAATVGSLIPLAPFFLLPVSAGMFVSIFVAGLTLFVVGAYKSRVMAVGRWQRSGLQMAVIGLAAALVGYLVGLVFRVPPG
jgi:VIT1/CCC1 family predicted Fe2+/Mn2+ transporter